ncbi:MAG: GAF domain-containing protein [Candidatus Bathyarchaeota archaeon]|nr:GAF domain-containing protein [Candidatus Bathyarchaeota archaeon]
MTQKPQNFVAFKEVLADILGHIHNMSDCQSVAIRLVNNGDYPYIVNKGFPEFFIQKESSLCAKDDNGDPIIDDKGDPLLECMCGNVLQGRFDPKMDCFTKTGTFWTNSTSRLLETTTEKQRLGRTRNMCNHSGYESVALIPMRNGNKTLGLIQLNDPRENMFTAKSIEKFEALAENVGAVVLNAFEIQQRIDVISEMVNGDKTAEE